jgi:NitT/TauT family transport system substrate-binding protein
MARAVDQRGLTRAGSETSRLPKVLFRRAGEQGRDWFGPRLPKSSRIQWFAYNAGPGAMEVIFAGSLDFAYVGP